MHDMLQFWPLGRGLRFPTTLPDLPLPGMIILDRMIEIIRHLDFGKPSNPGMKIDTDVMIGISPRRIAIG